MQKRHTDRERYFNESARTTLNYYMPYIDQYKKVDSDCKILEVGCGEGGNLLPFAKRGCKTVGVDLCESRIQQAQLYFRKNDLQGTFTCCDFFRYAPPTEEDEKFDIILLHDVIEHVSDKLSFMANILQFLKKEGVLFIAFPAWQMAFGGHQQICHHRFWSKLPYWHLLPTRVYLFILKRLAHENAATIHELLDIKACKTPIELFEKLVKRLPVDILNRQLWLINPHYLEKFGLYPRKLSPLLSSIHYFRNYISTSCFYLLRLKNSNMHN